MAVQAIQDGAYDFIEKPFSAERLIEITERAIEKRQLTLENEQLKRSLKASQTLGPRIIGDTAVIQNLRETISAVADTHAIYCCLEKRVRVKSWWHVHSTSKALEKTPILSL